MRPSSAPPATSTVHRTRLFFHCTATTLATAIVLLSPYLPITNARTLHHHRHHRVHQRHHHMSNHSHISQPPAALPPDAGISPTEPPSAFPAEVDNSPSQLPHHDRPSTPSFSPAKPPSLPNAKPPSIHLAKPPMPSPAKPPSLSHANSPSISPARPPSHFPDKAPSSSPHSMPPSFSPSKPPALSLADPPSSRPKKLPLSPVNPQPHPPAEPPSPYPVAGPPLLPPVMAKAKPPSIAPAVTKAKPPSLAPAIAKARPPSLAPVMAKAKPPSLAPAIAKAKPPSLAPAIVKARPPSLSPAIAKARAPTLAPEMPKARPPSLAPAMAKAKPPHFYPANPPALSPAGPAKDNSTTSVYDVRAFGAVGNGSSDDTRAFRAAWKAACAAESAVLLVPSDGVFMVTSTIFSGPCLSGMTFQIDGVLMPPDGPKSWPATDSRRQWIVFYRADGMALRGRGTIEGNGEEWWNLPCKPHRGPNGSTLPGPCDSPALIRFFLSYNVTVKDLRIENSPQFHVKFDGCEGVRVDGLFISSPAFSPNTDGVHIENTKSVQIYNSKISNGDDCISIGTGCSHVHIENVTCGHGHGISIGSLGVHNSRACVSNITVRNTRIRDSDNGVRIKTWQGGTGSVSGVEFDGVQMENVKNCIIIDQYYCLEKGCANQTSAVYVTGVAYRGIRGTYNPDGGAPIRLACSDAVACTDITMAVVELLPHGGGPATVLAEPYCWNAYGVMETLTLPPVYCLQEGKPQSLQDQLTSSC